MTAERVERRLAAVLAADVAGYSRLMGIDEEGTLARLKAVRKTIVDPTIANYRGRVVKTTGDGMLVEFASAVDAVRGAFQVQSSMAEQNALLPQDQRIEFRIGIHVGDIIVDDHDIFGDGVNIAARLEGIAEPGGVCMSNDAYRQVRGKVEIVCDDMGPQPLKNIAEPVQAWRVRLAGRTAPAGHSASSFDQPRVLPLPDRPSIAVLPFQNMSGDPEQEYFADGMVEDIITALSRFKSLFVIARNSSFTFKGKTVDVKSVGIDLGVRYVLEGSVRKAANRVRITGQLINASSGAHIWAERFDGELTDIFALQDQITEKVAAVIEPNINRAEIEAAQRRRENLKAHDLYFRALASYYSLTQAGLEEALQLCSMAIQVDGRHNAAARLAAALHAMRVAQGWSKDPKLDYDEIVRLCKLALDIDATDADSLALWGRCLGFITNDYDAAREMVDRAVALNVNSAYAWSGRGWTYRYMKKADEALLSFERAIRLNPLDPMLFDTLTGVGSALIVLGRDAEAAVYAKKALALNPRYTSAHRVLAAALAYLGCHVEAKEAAATLMKIEPLFTISGWANYGGRWQGQRFLDGLQMAGLPS